MDTVGVSNKTISKWENGKRMPDYAVVKSLCQELEISVAELMDGEESEESEEKSIRTYDDDQIKNFFSGILLGVSVAEMLVGVYVVGKNIVNR